MSAVVPRLPAGQQELLLGRPSDERGFVHVPGDIEGLYGDIQKLFSIEALRNLAFRHPELGLVDVSEKARADDAEWRAAVAETLAAESADHLSRIKGMAREGFQIQRANRPLKETA